MSSSKNLTSQIRKTQSKSLTVEQNSKGELSVEVAHSIQKVRFKIYKLIPGSYSEKCLIKYIEQNEWAANYEVDNLSITRQINLANSKQKTV